MRTRLAYIKTDLLNKIPFVMQEMGQRRLDSTMIRQRQIDIANMIKVIYAARTPGSFGIIYSESKIRMKKSFILYLHFCERFDFIRQYNNSYTITPKGYRLLELFGVI